MGDAEQLSGCSVRVLRAREVATAEIAEIYIYIAEIAQYFPALNMGEALVAT